MPTSTWRYRFEFEMNAWAKRFILPLTGHECAFLVALRESGTVRRIYVAPPGRAFGPEQKDRMIKQNPAWFLFVPYHDGGSAYLEWQGLTQGIAERWTGRPFERDDFLDVRSAGRCEAFPTDWRVVVA